MPSPTYADAEAHYGHPLQYAYCRGVYVGHTERMADLEVRQAVAGQLDSGWTVAAVGGSVERYNRCPTCEQWSPCDVRRVADRSEEAPGA